MSEFFGWYNTSVGIENARQLFDEIVNLSPRSLKFDLQSNDRDMIAAASASVAKSESEILVAYAGLIHWINVPIANLSRGATCEKLIDAYKQQGPEFVSNLKGAFSLVLVDRRRKRVLLALDKIGQKSLYYTTTSDGVVFATSLRNMIQHPDVKAEISNQAIFDYVYFHHCPSPGTIYRDVNKLEGGQYILIESGKVGKFYYWKPEFKEHLDVPEHEARERLLSLLSDAVQRDALTPAETGAFLSGGLDSSTVSGLLAQVYPGQCNTFSIGFPVEDYDESEYARAAVKRFGTNQHEYCLTPEDTVSAIEEIAAFYDEPFGNSSALPALYCARLAKENGIKRLLAGDGGDELFAGNERYQWQLLFERYHRVPRVARGILERLLRVLPSAIKGMTIPHKASRYVALANIPLPERLQTYNFLHRHKASNVFVSDFLGSVETDEPINLLEERYHRPVDAIPLNRMLYLDWKTTLHDNDLVKVNKMCELADVDVVYPMLDEDVIELSINIPSSLKMKNGELRGFFKQSVSDFLPYEIINKSKHGFGLPFGVWLRDYAPLMELAYDSINTLKKRDIFSGEFLDHAVEMHKSVHASYYGELIWILMMLEQWFTSHQKNSL